MFSSTLSLENNILHGLLLMKTFANLLRLQNILRTFKNNDRETDPPHSQKSKPMHTNELKQI